MANKLSVERKGRLRNGRMDGDKRWSVVSDVGSASIVF
jgi:hypothetical protein